MRLFDDDVTRFPVGERIFDRVAREYIPRTSWTDPPHYRIKNTYFESSDLNLYYVDADQKKTVAIRVALADAPQVGGSVSYADIGLVNRASVGAFVSKFDTIGLIGTIDGKLDYIAATILQHWRAALEDAMRREIVEETTADGGLANWDVPLIYRRVAVERGERTTITFFFGGCGPVQKVREMDVFPMMFEGQEVNAYFVYGRGQGRGRYLARLPYRDGFAKGETEGETDAEPANEIIPTVPNAEPIVNQIIEPTPEKLNTLPNVLAQTLVPGNEIELNEYNMPINTVSAAKAAPPAEDRVKINYNYVPKKIQTRVRPRGQQQHGPRPQQTRQRRRFKPYRR